MEEYLPVVFAEKNAILSHNEMSNVFSEAFKYLSDHPDVGCVKINSPQNIITSPTVEIGLFTDSFSFGYRKGATIVNQSISIEVSRLS